MKDDEKRRHFERVKEKDGENKRHFVKDEEKQDFMGRVDEAENKEDENAILNQDFKTFCNLL
jgi:hypothetical protein